jgi:uncharacterized membrane protein (DUF2068 family)
MARPPLTAHPRRVNAVAPSPAKPPHEPLERGVRAIVAYKLVKAVLMVLAAIALWAGLRVGAATWLAHIALDLGPHAASPWVAKLCGWLSLAFQPGRFRMLELLLVGDAILSAAEAWVLERDYPWGRWLVVVATGSLLPFEVYEIIRHPRWTRFVVFAVNAVILLYLARHVHHVTTRANAAKDARDAADAAAAAATGAAAVANDAAARPRA